MSGRRSLEDLRSRKRFEPREVEPRLMAEWLESGIFHPEPTGSAADNYSIAFPPPNVTGDLHMGHALQATTQDTLIRHARQRGRRAKFILGTDHAGIATQMQVERQLAREGTSREELGRERFDARMWEWRARYGSSIIDRLKQIGASFDYEEERFTLDSDYAAAVVKVFVELFQRGYIHRDHYLVNWDPGSGSAISDLEVEPREETDKLVSIAYPLADGEGEIVVATVRPETMLGDTAVAVHPGDERYAQLIGKEVILPLVGRRLPIIADDYVKRDFGTGALKITPGHDPNDFEIGRRHDLPIISVIGEDGRMSAEAGERFAGLTVAEAQAAVLAALDAEGLLRGSEPYTHEVPYSQRSGQRIEPLISLQWFMRMDDLARPAIAAVRHGRVRFFPPRWGDVYLDWMEGIRPWCISRQLWWGHRLPVYYCDACEETYVAEAPPERCGACDGPLRQDEDVLDTWFSSALWPFATLGWPAQTAQLAAFYPTDVLVTARDIISLWVARMIMMGLEFRGEVPFGDVYITSIIQAADGRRMSKSLGTGVDPIEAIQKHGADALRFGLLVMSSTQDVRYSEEKIEQGQGLANKLFNASRFVVLSIDPAAAAAARPSAIEDRWILARLWRIDRQLHERLATYDFTHAALELYDFIYGELCDWYLELIKPRLRDADPQLSSTLRFVLRETLALAHPLLPFVTEEMWSYLRDEDEGLLAGRARERLSDSLVDPAACEAIERVIAATQAVRSWREAVGLAPGARVVARIDADGYEEVAHLIAAQARLELRDRDSNGVEPQASVPVPGGAIAILEGVDLAAHEQRAEKRRAKLEAEIARAKGKLENASFIANAPPEVVAKEREKLAALEQELEEL